MVSLILEANGLPVIAHPARYKLSYNLLTYMFEEFVSFGGVGIEVATGSHSSADIEDSRMFLWNTTLKRLEAVIFILLRKVVMMLVGRRICQTVYCQFGQI